MNLYILQDGDNALIYAAEQGYANIVQVLIEEQKMDPHYVNHVGRFRKSSCFFLVGDSSFGLCRTVNQRYLSPLIKEG